MLDALSITEIFIARDGKPCRYDKVKLEAQRTSSRGCSVQELGGVQVQRVAVRVDPRRDRLADGGISGYITITVWPTPQVLERLEAIAVHELHHNVRYSPGGVVRDPMTVTVGEQVISEGLADVFAAELYGDRGYTHFVSESAHNNDGVLTKVANGLHITGMQNFTAWVHGDASARLLGAEPVGLPTGAGYAAGTRLVRAYLDATGSTAAQSIAAPADEVLRVAAPQLGLRINQED